jgi:histidine triad (HIT) family protein
MKDCVFCKIIEGQIPSTRVFENDAFLAIRDIRPQAKHHILVFPKEHLADLDAAFPEKGTARADLVGNLMQAGTRIAREQGFAAQGFRAVINHGPDAGQTVFHIHLHILGGELLDGFGS